MKFYQKLDGASHISAREYDIAENTAIKEGQLVKLTDGLVTAAAAGETGAVLGIAAENHSGSADALDNRANGKKIMVIDDRDVVMQCAAPQITAASGTATTIVASTLATFTDNDFKGGYVKLISKAAESTNTDAIGQMRRITGSTASSKTFTVESGGAASAGDVYAVFPPVGFAKGNLAANGTGVVLTATANLPVKVIGRDEGFGLVNLMIGKHVFGSGN